MIRNVNLNLLTPYDPIGKAREFQERIESENIEFNKLWKNIDRVDRASFIFKTDIVGLIKWEELLSIRDVSNLSFEDRVKNVYIEWNRRVIWTERSLKGYLDDLIGVGRYTVEIKYNEYAYVLEVAVSDRDVDLEILGTYLRRIIPANLGIELRLGYNSEVLLNSSSGDLLRKAIICGQIICGNYPNRVYSGDAYRYELEFSTTAFDSKSFYIYPNSKVKSGQVNVIKDSRDIIYMQDFNDNRLYDFKEDEDVK